MRSAAVPAADVGGVSPPRGRRRDACVPAGEDAGAPLDFEVAVNGGASTAKLRLSGGEGVKEFLRSELGLK